MSTQQALGVVGGVVGMFFGYPQLGFVVGSLVGGLLTPKEKIEGPRVEDLKVQVSTYGAGIPVVYGNARVGGNVIWSTDKIETETTEDVGKGGGAENTTYRYFVHMRIRLCETPADGSPVAIRKIWQDGKLVFDASLGMPIMSAIASEENPHAFLVLYQGDEAQLPDPIEEVFLGIGNVPAYRGGVDVRMNAVECPGGRVPQFSFEVCRGASYVTEKSLYADLNGPSFGWAGKEAVWSLPIAVDTYQSTAVRASPLSDTVVRSEPLNDEAFSPFNTFQPPYALVGAPSAATVHVFGLWEGGNVNRLYSIYRTDVETGEVTVIYTGVVGTTFGNQVTGVGGRAQAAFDQKSGMYAIKSDPVVGPSRVEVILDQQIISTKDTGISLSTQIAIYDEFVYLLTASVVTPSIPTLSKVNARTGSVVAQFEGPSVVGFDPRYSALHASGQGVAVLAAGTTPVLFAVEPVSGTWTVRAADASLMGGEAFIVDAPSSAIHYSKGYAVIGPSASGKWTMIRFDVIQPEPAGVAFILADQCRRSGLLPTQFDVSGIPESIHGYTLANPASARSNIQPLMTAFAIDATEEDGKLKFFKRASKSSVATILYEELGTVEGDSEAGDPMPLTRAQDAELPRSVSASYTNKDFDYQTGTEKAIRQIFDSQNDMMVDLAMSTSSDHAATVAQAILYDSHNDRNKRSLKVSRKYAFLSAGDVVTVEYPVTVLSQWRIVKITDTGALIEIDCVPFDAAIYTQTAAGATGYAGQTVAPLVPPTRLQILDIPILRDQDNNAGLYTAMAGFDPGWPGGSLQTWDDPGNIENRGTVEREAPIGFAETLLGDWTSGIVDESNLLTVNVAHSELNSISYDALLTGALNVAAVGAAGRWEIIKFRTAESLGNGRYILSGLMRGQRGTEWARGTHQVGDWFVLLAMAGMLRPNFDAGSIGQVKTYRAVTKGRSPAAASTQTYANTAEGLETFSPTNLDKSISGGDITLSVVRRTRLSENWLLGIVPVGEDAERFEFELFTDNAFTTVRRVIVSNTRFATYTAVMQTADGYVSGPLYVRVYQLSGVVGRGRALQETI